MQSFRTCLALTVLCALLGACAARPPEDDGLYQALGARAGLAGIVDNFLEEMSRDEVIVDSFAETDIAAFRAHLIDQLCELSGGPCVYEGRSMAEAHRGMGVDARMFNAMVSDFKDAMDRARVPRGAQNRLLGLLAPMYEDVTDPGPGEGAGAPQLSQAGKTPSN